MNKKPFTINDFKAYVLQLMSAHGRRDSVALENLDAEIENLYKETLMPRSMWQTLHSMQTLFMDDWRKNWKNG